MSVSPNPEQLKEARLAIGRTQVQLAKLLGVTFATYSRWENGHVTPGPKNRTKLWHLVDMADKYQAKQEPNHEV